MSADLYREIRVVAVPGVRWLQAYCTIVTMGARVTLLTEERVPIGRSVLAPVPRYIDFESRYAR